METALQIIVGIAVGTLAAGTHLRLSWDAAQRTVESSRPAAALALMPIRTAIVALALSALALWAVPALVAGVASFAVTHRFLRARWYGGER